MLLFELFPATPPNSKVNKITKYWADRALTDFFNVRVYIRDSSASGELGLMFNLSLFPNCHLFSL